MKSREGESQVAIPSRSECEELMGRYHMLENIVRHSLVVCRVGVYLSGKLSPTSGGLDLEEVEAAALLHDITKTRSFRTGENHAASGARLLKELGYPRIGEIVEQHIQLRTRGQPRRISSEEMVNYADKRVRHEEIVSLKERFIDLLERYGISPGAAERITNLEREMYLLERKIFDRLDFGPDDLSQVLSDQAFGTLTPDERIPK